ncbi:MAG: helix-turn-helix transcriptional regulator [Blastocatellia bacterium]
MTPETIRERRQRLKLTQGELAARLGVALNTVSRWENGLSTPESGEMLDLALNWLEMEQNLRGSEQAREAFARLEQSRHELERLLTRQQKSRRP